MKWNFWGFTLDSWRNIFVKEAITFSKLLLRTFMLFGDLDVLHVSLANRSLVKSPPRRKIFILFV